LDTNYFNPEFGIDLQQRWKDKKIAPDGTGDGHIRVRMALTSANRRFYSTSKGLYGLGPPVTSIGDIVCVFLGGKTPFLIRASEKYYEIVSETYVQGLMSGEAVDALKRGILKEETFALRRREVVISNSTILICQPPAALDENNYANVTESPMKKSIDILHPCRLLLNAPTDRYLIFYTKVASL
jgi:hypothetical protein